MIMKIIPKSGLKVNWSSEVTDYISFVILLQALFLCISIAEETEMASQEFDKNSLDPCCPNLE